MEFKFKIMVGNTEIEINEKAENHQEFFERIAFFSGLPTKGPNGADDLQFVVRKTSKGDVYYSLISEKDDAEFKFGVHKSAAKTLFPKGWTKLFKGQADENGEYGAEEQTPASQPVAQQAAPTQAAKVTAPARPIIPARPVTTQAAAPAEQVQQAAKPVATPPVSTGIRRPVIPTRPVIQAAAPVETAAAEPIEAEVVQQAAAPVRTTPAAAPTKPVVNANVNSVLAKYGIKK